MPGKKTWFLVIQSILTTLLAGQTVRFTPENGISQSTVYSILEDRQGLIWLSTGNGVDRYNGSGFSEVPVIKNPVSKSNAAQGKMVEDGFGNIWIGGIPGLYRSGFKEAGFEYMSQIVRDSAAANAIIHSVNDSQVWFSAGSKAVVMYNIYTKKAETRDYSKLISPPESIIKFMVIDDNYMLSTHEAIYVVAKKGGKLVSKIPLPSVNLMDIFPISRGTWVLTFSDHAAFCINIHGRVENNTCAVLGGIGGMRCIIKNGNELFTGTADGRLLHFQINPNGALQLISESGQRTFDGFQIISLFMDHNRQLWIGTDGGGLYKQNLSPVVLKRKGVRTENNKDVRSEFVRAFLEDKYHRLWVGTYEGGVNWYDKNFYPAPNLTTRLSELRNKSVTALFKDSKGKIWLGANNGIYITNDEATELLKTKLELPVSVDGLTVNNFCETAAGRLFCASTQGVLEYSFENQTWRPSLMRGTMILTVFSDAQSRLWISKYWTQLKVFPPQFKATDVQGIKTLFPSLNSRHVVFDDKRNVFVVATEDGVKILDKDANLKASYRVKEGLSNAFVYGTLIDNLGNYWVSTNNGINCIDPEKGRVLRFGVADGAQSREFNSGAFLKLSSGYFVFGGISGFNYFKPEDLLLRTQKNKIVISDAWFMNSESGDKVRYSMAGMKLEWKTNFVEVSFALTDFTDPGSIRYYYKLNNNSWMYLGNKGKVMFSNLAPGNYKLFVKCFDHNGRGVGSEMVMHFEILTPFYRSWLFFLLVILTAGVLVYALTRYLYGQRLKVAVSESKRIEELHALRMNISRELHDNLGANLSRVSLLTHKLREMPEKTDVKQAVASISQLASEMNGQVRNIVWSIDNNYDNLESLRTYMRQFASTFLEENNIEYNIQFCTNLPDMPIGPDIRQALFSVLKESLNNAVKHSGSNKIWVFFETHENGSFQLRIKDQGIGFDTSHKKPFSHGLRNIKQRLDELGFNCAIVSAPDEGCEIVIEGKFNIPL